MVERGRREALCPLTSTCTASPRWWWEGLNWDQRGEVVSLVALEGGRWELDTRIPDIALFTNSTGQLTLVHFEGREFSLLDQQFLWRHLPSPDHIFKLGDEDTKHILHRGHQETHGLAQHNFLF